MDTTTADQETYQLARDLKAALQTARHSGSERFYQLGLRLCQHLLVKYEDLNPATVATGPVALAAWQERKAKHILGSTQQDKLLIAEVASQCAMSRSHFSRAFKKSTGMSPQEWSLNSRIERAQRLLTESSLSMCQIALECGFADQSHFSRTFSKLTGTSPKRWQRCQSPVSQHQCATLSVQTYP
ncbi:helix-turn-helix domain-containing protein [Pseudomonas matsuisoli]|uniref:HTH araC/xylS-type domain-containing protein n=1 Tax=Pseudomonas matsuisoli TaxID=1515666 RepID=A0A917PQY1_9PSED|nr:AraC family transcriptional regulator [Pseudomonas matsuisoli]GGJ87720.1 hypothetical protein GCM10009304_11860 [Pseudomonas matsuisoli]